ncbi:hypothetical protein PGT21_008908 [Puccinia graminis f. sp. tritici]|uniref:Uncharacterized protein n=1 Tax=Puccinia graminis f. sp. tritici TaxID=56615 RepID=A0A5B0MEK6_PUCGR|nr:hypothetical protein PGT21_008908 [Puccinia graminis f. sp. tritici]
MELKMISPADLAKDVRTAVKVKQHVITQGAAQLVSGPSNSVSAEEFNVINVYMNQIYETHPPNVKYKDKIPVDLHPTDLSRYIPLTPANVQEWAAALQNQASACGNDVTDPIRYGIGQFIGSDRFFVTRYRKKGYWIAHPIRYPEYRIAAGSIAGLGIGIASRYRSDSDPVTVGSF